MNRAWIIVGLLLLGVLVAAGVAYAYSSSGSGPSSGDGWEAASDVDMTEELGTFMDELSEEAGGLFLFVTSAVRQPRSQAEAMLEKLEGGATAQDLLDLYARDDLVSELLAAPRDVDAWTEIIADQVSRGDFLSVHLTGRALDLRTSGGGEGAPGQLSTAQANAVLAAAVSLGADGLVEDNPPHLHLELESYRMA